MRTIDTLPFALALVLVSGCSLLHYGIFTSTLNEDITLELRQLSGSGTFNNPDSYKLAKGRTQRAVCQIAEVTALDASGRVLFRQVLPGFAPEWNGYQKQGERRIYYFVTRDGAYPIPVKWRENWREHQSEIIAGFDLKAARQKLVKMGALKE
jgi:hypothetical protein